MEKCSLNVTFISIRNPYMSTFAKNEKAYSTAKPLCKTTDCMYLKSIGRSSICLFSC